MITYQDIKSGAVPVGGEGLSLAIIQIDGGTQSRATLNQHVVDDYAEAIQAGATFPPIVVFYDGKKHWLADGFHRFHAYQKVGREKVAADVRQGTRRDAILHSVGANETHGLRRTRDDKRRAVLTLLNDSVWGKWTDREIGRACQVDHKTVGKFRAELPGEILTERVYTTKHGTTATMRTAGINASRIKDFCAENTHKSGGDEKQEITSQTVAQQGVGGGDEPQKPVKEITELRLILAELIALWELASDDVRAAFLRHVNSPRAYSVNPHGEPVAVAANTEQVDVDRSAERAAAPCNSAQPVSPDGATRRLDDLGTVQDGLKMSTDGQPKTGLSTDCIERPIEEGVTGGESAAAGETGMVLGTGRERPLSVGGDADGDPEARFETVSLHQFQSDGDAFAAVTGSAQLANAAGVEPSPSDLAVAGKPQAPRPSATAKSFQTLSPADRIKALRPNCLRPELCAGSGRQHCYSCRKAAGEGEAA